MSSPYFKETYFFLNSPILQTNLSSFFNITFDAAVNQFDRLGIGTDDYVYKNILVTYCTMKITIIIWPKMPKVFAYVYNKPFYNFLSISDKIVVANLFEIT